MIIKYIPKQIYVPVCSIPKTIYTRYFMKIKRFHLSIYYYINKMNNIYIII